MLAAAFSVVTVGVVMAVRPTSDSTPRLGGAALTGFAGAVPRFSAPPVGYHITYRMSSPGARPVLEQIWVLRPLQSFDEEVAAPAGAASAGTPPYLVTVSRLGEQVLQTGSAEATLLHVPFAPASHDVRLDAVVGPALRSGRLLAVRRSSVAGRRCRVFRSAGPLGSGPLARLRPGNSYVDTCVDGAGLVLREEAVRAGRTVSVREAVAVSIGAAAAAGGDYSMTAAPMAADQGGGAMQALTLDSRPAKTPFWGFSEDPAGFTHSARYAIVPSQPEAYSQPYAGPANGLGVPGSLVSAIDDVYVRGADAVIVDQGATLDGSTFAPPPDAQTVHLGAGLGDAQLVLSATGNEVVAEPVGGTRFVRVIATLPPEALITLVRSLILEPRGTLVKAAAR